MQRTALSFILVLSACFADPDPAVELASAAQELGSIDITRTHITGDVYHYKFVLPVGNGPNAKLPIHRVVRELAPWLPRPSGDAIMLMHGDFASFATNFAPTLGNPPSTHTGMATWLAQRGIDVWGLDRRWTNAPFEEADLSDFDAMGLDQQIDDISTALAFARGVRLLTGSGADRITLSGFSRGGQLAYFYASREAKRPPGLRHVKGLVPLDVYASLAPEDVALKQFYCDTAAAEYQDLANGVVDVFYDFQITVGQLVTEDPNAPWPWVPSLTRRFIMLWLIGQTYDFFPATPNYHLNAPILDEDGSVLGLRYASESVIATWLHGATPHQSLRESADTDAIICGDDADAFDVPLSRITVPLLSIAAAGGYGERANHSAMQVSSTDVTMIVIRQLPAEQEAEDYGHADILFASNAPTLAWQPLLSWLQAH